LSANSVRNALKSLPKTLDETYKRILSAINEEHRVIAVAALRWLCFSKRTLTIEELAEATVFSATVKTPREESPLEIVLILVTVSKIPSIFWVFYLGLSFALTPTKRTISIN
jgi:hypothetical protein